jgi:hypothetical protein
MSSVSLAKGLGSVALGAVEENQQDAGGRELHGYLGYYGYHTHYVAPAPSPINYYFYAAPAPSPIFFNPSPSPIFFNPAPAPVFVSAAPVDALSPAFALCALLAVKRLLGL